MVRIQAEEHKRAAMPIIGYACDLKHFTLSRRVILAHFNLQMPSPQSQSVGEFVREETRYSSSGSLQPTVPFPRL